MRIVVNYTMFAILATLSNLASQDASVRLYEGQHAVIVAMILGTGTGLVVKYVLDKKFIFRYEVNGLLHDASTLVLYSMMGVLTTGIFWIFELSFNYLFVTKEMRYLGAVIGLAIGYAAKYRLDKRLVFAPRASG